MINEKQAASQHALNPAGELAGDGIDWMAFHRGSSDALGKLYYQYFTFLLFRGHLICRDKETIRDCIHDLFADIWKNRMGLSVPYSVKAYLLTSLQRRLLTRLREQRFKQHRLQALELLPVSSPEEQLIAEQLRLHRRHWIDHAISALPKRQRQAISLRIYEELRYSEIAERMAISRKAVYNLLGKAIGAIQIQLKSEVSHSLS
jgi:RNA polymerase sigma factor (sigma-70 family)